MTITAYSTPQQFLDDTEELLGQRELENNLILGLCNGLADTTKVYDHCVFVNSFEGKQILASSIKTRTKAVVSSATANENHLRNLAEYYLNNKISLAGVFGETNCAELFSKFYGRQEKRRVQMMVHKLTRVNDLPAVSGQFEKVGMEDLDKMIEWTLQFELDAAVPVRKTKEETYVDSKSRIEKGVLYKLVVNGEIVSIAAIVRQTKNTGIVGLVYTPGNLRGKGYATTCVQKLSEHILKSGLKSCGLFADKANAPANSIYKRIGYFPLAEFTDIEFE